LYVFVKNPHRIDFTKTTINVADARGGENGMTSYKVYSYAMAIPAAAPMTFKVTL
jgi:hypothetical protein